MLKAVSRKDFDLVGLLQELHSAGVDLYLHQQELNTSTPAGKALFQMIGVFAEFYNLFNTANFGNNYNGNARSSQFKQPVGFMGGAGYASQMQLGVRASF